MENNETRKEKPAGPADFLANERTFLAWIRTSIAMMGFGFVIVKFAVFIRQVSLMTNEQIPLSRNRYSAAVGIVMVVVGALMASFAYIRFRHIQKQLFRNEFYPSRWLSLLVTLSIVIASVLLVIYLLPNL